MSDFVIQNLDLIVILVVIALVLGLVKEVAGKVISAIFVIFFVLRVFGIVPNYAEIFDGVKNIILQIIPMAGNLFKDTVKMFYDFFSILGGKTGA